MSLKYVVDAVCEILRPGLKNGQADSGHGGLIKIAYDQKKPHLKGIVGIEITIEEVKA